VSIVLARRTIAASRHVSLTAGMAVCETLRQLCPGAGFGLKWPNDLFARGRKIGGILVEVPARTPRRCVIGIGVNVNNAMADAPAELAANAIALADVAGRPFCLTDVLIRVLMQLRRELDRLGGEDEDLVQRWRSYCLLTGCRICIASGSRRTIGLCHGIGPDGALLVETNRGIEPCVTGTISLLDPSKPDEPERRW